MITFQEALLKGFEIADEVGPKSINELTRGADLEAKTGMQVNHPSFKFVFQDGDNEYELWFEKLLFNDQYYVALYKNQDLMTEKVVVKPGYTKSQK